MGQLKTLTDLIADRQQIYLTYDEPSDTWKLGVIFDGELQILPYSLHDLLDNNQSYDLDIKINVLACPVTRFCSYLSGQLGDEDFVTTDSFELRFDGIATEPDGEGHCYQGPAYITVDLLTDTEVPENSFDCYWLNPTTGWNKVTTSEGIELRGELRITKYHFYR